MSVTGVAVAFEGVEKRFGAVRALHPITLDIRPGEFLTLLGPSGSGKTTLLNIAAGFLDPDAGRVRIGARDITAVPPRGRNIGMVFQNYALFPHLDVFENVAYGLRVRKVGRADLSRRVEAALAMVQLDGFARRAVHQLSGGQQQRVALARAMVIEPDLLLMDEPLGALDRQLRKHVQLEIRRLHAEAPRTTIYVTHDQEEALVMSDRVAIMRDGVIAQIGTPVELYEAPRNAWVAAFLGESNLIPARIHGGDATHATVELDALPGRFVLPARADQPPPGPALLLLRPEGLATGAAEGPEAVVVESVYLGELTATRLRLATGQDVWSRAMNTPPLRVGQTTRIGWDPAKARLLPSEAAAGATDNKER